MRLETLPREALDLDAQNVEAGGDFSELLACSEQLVLRVRKLQIAVTPVLVRVFRLFQRVLKFRNDIVAKDAGFELRVFHVAVLRKQLRARLQEGRLALGV